MENKSEMEKINTIGRRNFIAGGIIAGIAIAIPSTVAAMMQKIPKSVRIGIITDLHHDLMPDGMERLEVFLSHMEKTKPDALLQMGDFAFPSVKNKPVVDRFNGAHETRMHVLGNHDTDAGHTTQECLDLWGMPAPYYTKMIAGISFIILDGNEKGSPKQDGYPSFIGEKQVSWLKQMLEELNGPVIIVSHQPLAGAFAVDNAAEIQGILSQFSDKILLAINGHTHLDQLVTKNNINYLHINSASYFWVGDKYLNKNYPDEVLRKHPILMQTCPYESSLFATVIVDPVNMTVRLEGTNSSWMGKSPAELGYKDEEVLSAGKDIAPRISNLKLKRK